MNINLIINLAVYISFFLALLVGGLYGLKRGLKKSSLRLGTLVIFLIVAGLITTPISKALLTINLSSLNINIEGNLVTTFPDLIKNGLFSINGFQEAAESMPSIMTLVEGLPVAVVNIIVFMLLIFVMQFISWIVFIILAKTTLKDTKLEKKIKKQKKLEKKNKKISQQPLSNDSKRQALPLPPPKKYRLWGALIGMVQGFILIFLVLIPITSLMSSAGSVISSSSSTTPLSIYAEEETSPLIPSDILSENSSDLIKNALGEEVISYFNTFNNSVPSKMLNLFGFNNVIFDSLTTIKVNGQNIAIRRDAVSATKIYDKIVDLRNQIDTNEEWSDLDFEDIRVALDIIFNTGIVKAFAEDVVEYAMTEFIPNIEDLNTLEYKSDILDGLDDVVSEYKNHAKGFLAGLKNDLNVLINVVEEIFHSGFFDEVMAQNDDYNVYIDIVKQNNYQLLSKITNKLFDSSLLRVATSKGLNIALDMGSSELSKEGETINLGQTDYSLINWTEVGPSLFKIIKNGIQVFEVINGYGLEIFDTPEDLLSTFSNEDISTLLPLIGEEIDLIKKSPLFIGQTVTPFTGAVEWLDLQVEAEDFIDTAVILSLNSWKNEFERFCSAIIYARESGVVEFILENNLEEIDTELVLDMLLAQTDEEIPDSNSYLIEILTSVIDSVLSKKPLVYLLNQAVSILSDSVPELSLQSFDYETFPDDQNSDIVNIVDNIAKGLSIFKEDFGGEDIDFEAIDVTRLAAILTSLQRNAFRIDTDLEVGNGNIRPLDKTVTDGGIFANFYISLTTYMFGNNTSINLKTVNWLSFFESLQNLSDSFESLSGSGNLEDLFDLGSEETQEFLEELLNALGLDGNIVESFSEIQNAIEDLTNNEITEEEVFEIISNALTDIINSTDEEGNNTIDTIINMIESISGDDTISEQISSEIIADEQRVSIRINLLLTNQTLNGVGLTSENMEEAIADLTCGATFVLQQAVNNGIIISYNIPQNDLITAVNETLASETVKTLVLNLFGITE